MRAARIKYGSGPQVVNYLLRSCLTRAPSGVSVPRMRERGDLAIDSLVAILQARAPRPLSIEDMTRLAGIDHYDRKRLKAALRKRRWGRVVWKSRGVKFDLTALSRELSVPGDERGVVLLTEFADRTWAILAS